MTTTAMGGPAMSALNGMQPRPMRPMMDHDAMRALRGPDNRDARQDMRTDWRTQMGGYRDAMQAWRQQPQGIPQTNPAFQPAPLQQPFQQPLQQVAAPNMPGMVGQSFGVQGAQYSGNPFQLPTY